MRRLWTLSGGLATAASLAIAGWALRASATPTARVVPAPIDGPSFMARGAGSCAASACHGGVEEVRREVSFAKRNEHTTWLTADPHADAYNVLLSERSQRIAKNLGPDFGPAQNNERCLACHATPATGQTDPDLVDSIRRDGVSCESCHGPAGGWIAEHTSVNWPGLSPDQKAISGFKSLRDLGTRAQTCAGCHVGAPADPSRGLPLRDVNHDFIAAGHPRLNWEFSAYVANYPKHWRIDPSEMRGLDGKLWKIGQVATMSAALDLLRDRADRSAAKVEGANESPWPELSEYSCYSCHFGLKPDPSRGVRDKIVPLGVPEWGSWNVPMVKALTDIHPGAPHLGDDLRAHRELMNDLTIDPSEVSRSAAKLKGDFDAWLRSTSSAPMEMTEVLELVSALNSSNDAGKRKLVTGWDSAAQLYLALASLYRSQGQLLPGKEDRKLLDELKRMLGELEFPAGYDSPRGFKPQGSK